MCNIPSSPEQSYTGNHAVDVFISYAHLDNQSEWITDFHAALETRLEELLGTEQLVVWRDTQLDRIDSYKDELRRCLARSAYFLSVLTPRYLASSSCQQELDWFTAAAQKNAAPGGSAQPRLIKVRKTKILEEEEPDEFDDRLGFEFYEKDPQNPQRFLEFGSRTGMLRYDKFADLVDDLAQRLNRKLRGLRKLYSDRAAPPRTVFLARTTSDLQKYRASIQAELTGRGYSVLPTDSLPEADPDLTETVEELLEKSDISVHLLGPRYGATPEDEPRSWEELLYDMALPQLARRDFHQLVWIAPAAEVVDPRQQSFLAKLRGAKPAANAGIADVLETTFETFKEGLLDVASRKPEAPVPAGPAGQGRPRSIYLVCDLVDLPEEQLGQIKRYLRKRGHSVELPAFQGELQELRAMEEELIGETDATLIYYGATRDAWVKQKRKSVLKVLSTMQKGAGYTRGLYLASPRDEVKAINYLDGEDFTYLEGDGFPPLLLLGDGGEFLPEKLDRFINVLSS